MASSHNTGCITWWRGDGIGWLNGSNKPFSNLHKMLARKYNWTVHYFASHIIHFFYVTQPFKFKTLQYKFSFCSTQNLSWTCINEARDDGEVTVCRRRRAGRVEGERCLKLGAGRHRHRASWYRKWIVSMMCVVRVVAWGWMHTCDKLNRWLVASRSDFLHCKGARV